MNPFSVGVAFWMFLAVAAVAGIIGDYKKRRLALEPLKLAIERGQQLDPAIIEQLLAGQKEPPLQPEKLQLAGIITIASGVGLAVLSLFLAQVNPKLPYVLLGVCGAAVCVGTGLLLAAKILARSRAAEQSSQANR